MPTFKTPSHFCGKPAANNTLGGNPMNTTEPIRNKHQVRQFINHFYHTGHTRNYVLATLCVHTALRIGDILSLTCNQVYDFKTNRPRHSITICEKKTGKTKIIALHKNIIIALKRYYNQATPGAPLIANPQTGKAITRVQAYRLLRSAAETIRLRQRVSCHSLRKTFGYHAWKGGISPAVIMEIYNHSSLAVTRRYLGVSQDDINAVYHGLSFG